MNIRISAGVLGIPPSIREQPVRRRAALSQTYGLPKEAPRKPRRPSKGTLEHLLNLGEEHLAKVEALLKALPVGELTDELLDQEAKLHALIEQIMAQLAERGR